MEIHVQTKHFVNDELQMNVVGNLDVSAKLLFQRQFRDPSAVELEFLELTRLVLAPTGENYDSIIEGAEFSITDQGAYLLHIDMRAPSPVSDAKSELLIAGKQLKWRAVECMGSGLRYGQAVDE